MIPPGRERDDIINRWLGYKWGINEHGWTWVETPSGYRDSWQRLLHHWGWYLPAWERPGEWSTDDGAVVKLAKVLAKRGYLVSTDIRPDDYDLAELSGLCSVRVRKPGTSCFWIANSKSLADAVTQVICQVAESERG